MAWQLLAAALPAAAKVAGTALSKPRQEDYKPQTDYMKKYLSYIRGRSSDREVMHQAMQPALRVAGKQGRQMQRQVGYDVAKSGLGGSGIEAQMRLSAGQQTQDALATATDKAVAAQTAETARVGEQAAGITAQIGAEEARADQAFESAESQWKRQLAGDVIGLGASVVGAGISQHGQNVEGFNAAKVAGDIGADVTYDQFIQQAKTGVIPGDTNLGLSERALEGLSPSSYAQHLGANQELVDDLKLASRYLGGDSGVKELMNKGYSPQQIAKIGKESNQLFINNFGKVDNRVLSRAIGMSTGLDETDIDLSVFGGTGTTSTTVTDEQKTAPKTVEEEITQVGGDAIVDKAKIEKPEDVAKPKTVVSSSESDIVGDVPIEELELEDVSGLKKPAAKAEKETIYTGVDSKGKTREIKVLSVDKDGDK